MLVGAESSIFEGMQELALGCRLLPKICGQGFATEAASALLEIEDSRNIREEVAFAHHDTYQSIRILGKLGFDISVSGALWSAS